MEHRLSDCSEARQAENPTVTERCLLPAEKAGIIFAYHWLENLDPSFEAFLHPGALAASHAMDKDYFTNKIESMVGKKFEQVRTGIDIPVMVLDSTRTLRASDSVQQYSLQEMVITKQRLIRSCMLRMQHIQDPTPENMGRFRQSLQPMRSMLAEQSYFGGSEPNFADIAVVAVFLVSGQLYIKPVFASFAQICIPLQLSPLLLHVCAYWLTLHCLETVCLCFCLSCAQCTHVSQQHVRPSASGLSCISCALPILVHKVIWFVQWVRAISPIKMLKDDDPIFAWRERMFDTYHECIFETKGYDYK